MVAAAAGRGRSGRRDALRRGAADVGRSRMDAQSRKMTSSMTSNYSKIILVAGHGFKL